MLFLFALKTLYSSDACTINLLCSSIRKAPAISDRCPALFLYLYLYAFIKSSGVIAGTSEFSKSLTLQVIM